MAKESDISKELLLKDRIIKKLKYENIFLKMQLSKVNRYCNDINNVGKHF